LFQVDPNAAVEAECILTERRTTRNREPRVTQTEVVLERPVNEDFSKPVAQSISQPDGSSVQQIGASTLGDIDEISK
jgi:hypothetical protein